jgi:hypothetical protein
LAVRVDGEDRRVRLSGFDAGDVGCGMAEPVDATASRHITLSKISSAPTLHFLL